MVWVCLGASVVGIAIALYVAYIRPDELILPGSTVMTSHESGNVEPMASKAEGPSPSNRHKDEDMQVQVVNERTQPHHYEV